jgi:hypothetical protein
VIGDGVAGRSGKQKTDCQIRSAFDDQRAGIASVAEGLPVESYNDNLPSEREGAGYVIWPAV